MNHGYLSVLMFLTLASCNTETRVVEASDSGITPTNGRVHLPTKCRPFYNDGTDRWIECMGVGYK